MFNLSSNCQSVFQNSCTILYAHQQCMRVPISPRPLQHLLLYVCLIVAILVDVKWYLTVVLICTFLVTNDVEHLFMYLVAICMSSLEKCLFKSLLVIFKQVVILLLSWKNWYVCVCIYIYSGYKFLISCMTCKYFLLLCVSVHLLDGIIWCTKLLNFYEIQLISVFFDHLCFQCYI